jgi:hypothetical protein
MPLQQDDSAWPLVIDTSSGAATDDDIERYVAAHDRYLARRELYAAVLDARGADQMSAAHRRRVAQWLTEHREELRRYHVALAFVSSSALIRGVLTAIYWLHPPPYPYKMFASLDEAKTWAREMIQARATKA